MRQLMDRIAIEIEKILEDDFGGSKRSRHFPSWEFREIVSLGMIESERFAVVEPSRKLLFENPTSGQ